MIKRCRVIFAQALIVVMLALWMTACPSNDFIERSANQSLALAKDTRDLISAVDEAYSQGNITKAQKDSLADNLIFLANGGSEFNRLVSGLRAQYETGVKIPSGTIDTVIASFQGNVVRLLVNVLVAFKTITPNGAVSLAIDTVRTTVLALASALGRSKQVKAQLAEVN